LNEWLRHSNQGINSRDQQQSDENAGEKKVHVRRTAHAHESIRAERRNERSAK